MNAFLKFWYFLLVLIGLKRPGRAKISILETLEKYEMAVDTMVYTLDLGPYDHDVVKREVLIRVEGSDQKHPPINLDPRENNTVVVSGPQDAKATIVVVDYDDGGNKTVPVEHEQILADTVGPRPGSVISVVAVEEIPGVDDPPAEDPPAEDPPAEDPPAEDPPAEEPPAEDPPAEEPPAEEPPAEEPPVEEPPVEEPPAEEPPVEEPPVEEPMVETQAEKPKPKRKSRAKPKPKPESED